jgi:hypothetical protein
VDATADFFMATKRVVGVSLMYFFFAMGVLIVLIIGLISIMTLGDFSHPEDGS